CVSHLSTVSSGKGSSATRRGNLPDRDSPRLVEMLRAPCHPWLVRPKRRATMHEIVGGIFTWPWFSQRHGYNFNGYLIRDPGGTLCIDPVEPDAATFEEIGRAGLTRIVVTNRNHI